MISSLSGDPEECECTYGIENDNSIVTDWGND